MHKNSRLPFVLLSVALSAAVTGGSALAQDEGVQSLAERSAIVVQGKVLKTNASDEPLVAASDSTAIVEVLRMYAGSEVAGDQKGRTVTVILSRPGTLRVGDEALFFGNPRFIGRSLTIADEGEVPAKIAGPAGVAAMESGVQARRDRPIRDRLSSASLVFRGKVESVRPIDAGPEVKRGERSEHDPEWQVATVRVSAPLRGDAGQSVSVVFPASRDIVWFNAPKLKPGQEAVFITHAPGREEETLYRTSGLAAFLDKQPAQLVTEPHDVLPPSDESRVKNLLASVKEDK